MLHTCKLMVFKSRKTGEIRLAPENVWHCKNCAFYKSKKLCLILKDAKFDHFITLTTSTPFHPPVKRILKLRAAFHKLRAAMKYRANGTGYAWAWGVGAKGKLNIHLLWRGSKPDLKRIQRFWHKRTGNIIVHMKPAGAYHIPYLGKNAAQLPSTRAQKSPFKDGDRQELGRFRRVGYSKNFSPKRAKKAGASEWELLEQRQRWTNMPPHVFLPPEETYDIL